MASTKDLAFYSEHKNECHYNLEENVIDMGMEYRDWAMGIIFLSQTLMGILGNFSLLSYYLFSKHKHTWRNRDVILTHLLIANSLYILFRGVPQTVAAFGLKQFLKDFVCNLFLYVQSVGRSVSICTTCLLSFFQAITISPKDFCWKKLKGKAPKCVRHSISFFWVKYMVVHFIFHLYDYTEMNSKNTSQKRNYEFCSIDTRNILRERLYTVLLVFPEVLFSTLIIWSSGSMIIMLYRHKQHVQHIRSSHVSWRTSPESRATCCVLALVCTFLTFYTISSILHGFIAILYNPSWGLVNTSWLISLCFPSFGPFILMSQDSTLLKLCSF